jgi:hypothetical protein
MRRDTERSICNDKKDSQIHSLSNSLISQNVQYMHLTAEMSRERSRSRILL